jgi:tetratricopeptide (TPR) repeat protein
VQPVFHIDAVLRKSTDLRRSGRPAVAARQLEAALAQQPRIWPLWHDLGLALAADGRPDEAADAYRHAQKLGGERAAATWVNLGNALRSAGNKAEAVDAYLTAMEIDPELAPAFYNMHAALYDDAAPWAAVAALERAHTLRPEHADTNFYLAALRRLHRQPHRQPHSANADELLAALPSESAFLVDSLRFVENNRDRQTRLFADTFETLGFALRQAPTQGLVMELGVRHGTSLRFLAAHADGVVHGFDSFEGLPTSWGEQDAGLYSTSGRPPTAIAGALLHSGRFRDSLPPFLADEPEPLRLLHVDCDLHSSTAVALALLAPRVVVGTTVIFDEYLCNPGWRSEEHRAWTQACERHGWRYRYLAFAPFTKQAVVRVEALA